MIYKYKEVTISIVTFLIKILIDKLLIDKFRGNISFLLNI